MVASAAVPPVAPMVTMTMVMMVVTSCSAVVSWVPGAGLDGRAQVVDHEVDVVVVVLGVAAAATTAAAEEGGDARLPPGRSGERLRDSCTSN